MIIRTEKAHGLVLIEANLESESIVKQPLSCLRQPRTLTARRVSLAFSGPLLKAEKHSTIKSGPTRHYTRSPYIPKPHFNVATRSQWQVFRSSLP